MSDTQFSRSLRHAALMRRLMAGVASTAALSLALSPVVWAAPGQGDIDRAKAEEAAAQMSVARIEVELAKVAAEAQAATQAAAIAAEKYNGSRVALNEATAAAEKAQKEAQKAQEDYLEGRRNIAAVVQTAYRSGGTGLDSFAPYLEADGLRQVESRKNSLEAIGDAASTEMQKVAALEQVAKVMSSVAEKAKTLQEQATTEMQAQSQAAQNAANMAVSTQANIEMRRAVLYEELARKQNTTVELIKAKEKAEAEARARAEAEAARRAAEEAARRLEEQRRAAAASAASSQASSPAWVPPPAVAPNADKAAGAIAAAKSMLGATYVWGGEGGADGGYDCSGMVMVAYQTQGIYLEHWSVAQYRYGATGGQYVPMSEAEPGDLVFWSNDGTASGVYHVAIYLGGGQIIEAATFGIPLRITGLYNHGAMMPYAVRVA